MQDSGRFGSSVSCDSGENVGADWPLGGSNNAGSDLAVGLPDQPWSTCAAAKPRFPANQSSLSISACSAHFAFSEHCSALQAWLTCRKFLETAGTVHCLNNPDEMEQESSPSKEPCCTPGASATSTSGAVICGQPAGDADNKRAGTGHWAALKELIHNPCRARVLSSSSCSTSVGGTPPRACLLLPAFSCSACNRQAGGVLLLRERLRCSLISGFCARLESGFINDGPREGGALLQESASAKQSGGRRVAAVLDATVDGFGSRNSPWDRQLSASPPHKGTPPNDGANHASR
mmetsp:Transcript_28806/g.61217  ORF Transcript_28806/g.61217 Transcript_28806/m.61217 type:complete len:291 (-) Transcript_28806:118-990(-)